MAITVTIPGGAVQLTGNPVEIICTGGAKPVGATEYKIMLKILSEDSKLFGAPFVMAKPIDNTGKAEFNISGYVDQYIAAVFQWPVSGASHAYPTQAFNITVQPGERYIDSNGAKQETWGAESEEFQMLKGGLSHRQVATMKVAGFTFYEKYILSGKFLTARPSGDVVHPLQPVKLWFMPIENRLSKLAIDAYYDDGSSEVKDVNAFMNTDYLYEFNVNPVQLGYTLEPTGKRMTHFDVYLHYNGSVFSETRRFVFDWSYCERPVYLMFANSFGGVDDVYFSGFIQDKFATEGSIGYRPPQSTDTVLTPTLVTTDKTGQNRWSINTGWKSLTTIQYLRDLLVAKQAWYLYSNISQTTVNIIPIVNITTGEVLIDRMNDMYALQIDFDEAHQSKFSFDNRTF